MDMKPKGLIKRVFEFAVAELERRSRPPPPYGEDDASAGAEPAVSASDTTQRLQPAPTDSVSPTSVAASLARGATRLDGEQERDHKSVRPPLGGLHLARGERGSLKVRWSITAGELERSASLIDDGAVLCLRLVSFVAARDHVLREVQDRPSIQSQGECEIARPDGRAVVSLGLRAGGRFVSIAHHVV